MEQIRSRERTLGRPQRKAVILVLDDEESVGVFVKAALPESTFRTIWCSDISGAIRAIEEIPPDLALVDITLAADSTGFDLLKHIRSTPQTERIPIVMMTGMADTINRERSLRMGADRYLIKPVRPDTLRRVINEVLSARDDIWWSLTLRSNQVQRLRA